MNIMPPSAPLEGGFEVLLGGLETRFESAAGRLVLLQAGFPQRPPETQHVVEACQQLAVLKPLKRQEKLG